MELESLKQALGGLLAILGLIGLALSAFAEVIYPDIQNRDDELK